MRFVTISDIDASRSTRRKVDQAARQVAVAGKRPPGNFVLVTLVDTEQGSLKVLSVTDFGFVQSDADMHTF